MVTLIDPEEAGLELDPVDRLVDVVAQPCIEDIAVVAAHLMRLLGGDSDMSHAVGAGDESTTGLQVQWLTGRARADVHLLSQTVGSGETHEAFHTAQSGVLGRAFGDGDPVGLDARLDGFEGGMVVEFPPESGGVLGGTALQQEATLVVIEAETHDTGQGLIEVHPDGVAAEPSPFGELLGLDHDITEVDLAEH